MDHVFYDRKASVLLLFSSVYVSMDGRIGFM